MVVVVSVSGCGGGDDGGGGGFSDHNRRQGKLQPLPEICRLSVCR